MDSQLFAAAAVTVIGSLTAAAVTVINALQNASYRRQAEEKRNVLVGKAEEIKSLVDGSASSAAERQTRLEQELKELHAKMNELQEARLADVKQATERAHEGLT